MTKVYTLYSEFYLANNNTFCGTRYRSHCCSSTWQSCSRYVLEIQSYR